MQTSRYNRLNEFTPVYDGYIYSFQKIAFFYMKKKWNVKYFPDDILKGSLPYKKENTLQRVTEHANATFIFRSKK